MMILPSIPVVLNLCHAYLANWRFWLSWGIGMLGLGGNWGFNQVLVTIFSELFAVVGWALKALS